MKQTTMALLIGLASCAPEGWGPEALSRGTITADEDTLALGHESYAMYCSGCHGVNGDGEGPAARFLEPKPRDFRVGLLKFAAVPAGQDPHVEDYERVITYGLAGTAMPSFRFVPHEEQLAIITYLQTFRTEAGGVPGERIKVPRDPYAKKPQFALAKGEALYHGLADCASCHPAYATREKIIEHRQTFNLKSTDFRDDMYVAVTKKSDWGAPITPPDFLTERIKTGDKKETIVTVIAAGVGGTAMPNWSATLTRKQLWALAYYIESLAALRGTPEARALVATLENQEGSK